MIRAILFDLDDTLLGNDMDRFLKAYFGLLAPHVAAFVPPEKFIPALLAATRAMVKNTDPGVTNQQAFAADFFPRVSRTMDEMMPVFDDFYATQFGKLRSHTRCLPEARAVVRAAFDAGYEVVIATNPLFPDTAIRQRMEWADVADFPFKLVTSYETMHFSKPYPEYYLEIAGRIGRQPDECVMVGDDWGNDIAPAMRAGLRVYWVNTSAEVPPGFDPRARGTLAEFKSWYCKQRSTLLGGRDGHAWKALLRAEGGGSDLEPGRVFQVFLDRALLGDIVAELACYQFERTTALGLM